MRRYNYESFTDEDIEEIISNIDYEIFQIVDSCVYGGYFLDVYFEKRDESIIIHIYDIFGCATVKIDKNRFLKRVEDGRLEKYLNEVLYYNYVQNDPEDIE